MKNVVIGRLFFEPASEQKMEEGLAPFLRSYIVSMLQGSNSLPQDEVGKPQYPLIQYKVIHGNGVVMGIGEEAVDSLHEISRKVRDIRIQGKIIKPARKCLDIAEEGFGLVEQKYNYHWLTPWLALNPENQIRYQAATSEDERKDLLSRCLIGHLISAAKYLEYKVPDKIIMQLADCQTQQVSIKGETAIGFTGNFHTNFLLPDLIGLGKGCSSGLGCCAMVQ